MNKCAPMGSRLLHRWLMFPLRDPRAINERLDVVEAFFRMPDERDVLEEQLHQVGDLERLVSKVATRRATPRDLLQIRAALVALEPIRAVCAEAREGALRKLGERLDPCGAVSDAIGRTIRPDAGLKGEFIAEGVSAELDDRGRSLMALPARDALAILDEVSARLCEPALPGMPLRAGPGEMPSLPVLGEIMTRLRAVTLYTL